MATINALLNILDSVLFASKSKAVKFDGLTDPTLYLISTHRQSYCGNIIYQDDHMIKFRTEALKPVKIMKSNIRQITILKHAYSAMS
jgi:hypothetical protein